jgi:hypothetical protein
MTARLKRKQKGQALVEFALVFPILVFLLMGIIDFGWIIFNYSQLYNSLREGLRYGSVPGYSSTEAGKRYYDCDGIQNRIVDLARGSGITASAIKIFYDDGRPYKLGDLTRDEFLIGWCNESAGGGNIFSPNTGSNAYATDAYTPESAAPGIDNGDSVNGLVDGNRINIDIQFNLRYLTPLIASFAPTGWNVHLNSSRTIFQAIEVSS